MASTSLQLAAGSSFHVFRRSLAQTCLLAAGHHPAALRKLHSGSAVQQLPCVCWPIAALGNRNFAFNGRTGSISKALAGPQPWASGLAVRCAKFEPGSQQQDVEEEEDEEEEEEGISIDADIEKDEEEDWGVSEAIINTGHTAWGEVALQSVRKVLEGSVDGGGGGGGPESGGPAAHEGLELFSLTAVPQSKRLSIRLDKLSDRYGSPSLAEVESFCRAFNAEFAEALGEAEAGDIEVEVSSPGAERPVRVPGDLQRFADLPMKVEFINQDLKVDTRVLQLVSVDNEEGSSQWQLANVRINRTGGKGVQQLSRKQRDVRFDIPLQQLQRVNLFIDL